MDRHAQLLLIEKTITYLLDNAECARPDCPCEGNDEPKQIVNQLRELVKYLQG